MMMYSETPIKEVEQISYDDFVQKYKQDEWIKVGNWHVPLLSSDAFNSSQSKYYLKKLGIVNLPPIKYFAVGTETFVDKNGLDIMKANLSQSINSGNTAFINDLDSKLESARQDLTTKLSVFVKNTQPSYSEIYEIFETVLVILSSFEILRYLGELLEESIAKRFESLGISPVPLPELLELDRETSLYHFNIELLRLKETGYTQEDLKKLVSDFAHLNQYFLSGEGYDEHVLIEQIKNIKPIVETAHTKLTFTDEVLTELIRVMNRLAIVRLVNNDIANRTMYILKPVLQDLAAKTNKTFDQIISLPLADVLALFRGDSPVITDWVRRDDVAVLSADKDYCLSLADSKRFKQEFIDNMSKANIFEIKGSSTYRGVVRGSVRIVSGVQDFSSFIEGEVLVCSMTDPNYVPLMKRASAFVTDMGGILCHAAIISREMKKPCIIGTKIATKVLKNGDLVEVNADKGVVTIISKKDEPGK